MIESFYKSDAYWTAVKVLAVVVMIASAWELLRLHGIVLDMAMLQEIFYAALIGVAARVIVELSPRRRFPTARKTDSESNIIETAVAAEYPPPPEVYLEEEEQEEVEEPPYRRGR